MGKLNMEAVQAAKARLERQGGGGSNVPFDKLVNGKNVRRILWPKGDKELCYSEGFIHFGLGPEGKTSVVCRKTHDSHEYCPVCDYITQLQKSTDKNDKKLAESLKARKRVFFNVLDRDGDDELRIMPTGLTVQKQIIAILCDPDYGDITDPLNGRDVTIKRSGQGLNTEYTVLPKPITSPASTNYTPEQLEERMADLDSFWNLPSVEDAEKAIYGEDGAPSEPRNESGYAQNASSKSDDYDDMEVDELMVLCKRRGIPIPERASKLRLVALLTQYDEGDADGVRTAAPSSSEGVKTAIADALNRRRG